MAQPGSFVPKNGVRVEVVGKGFIGTISYVGMTGFAPGKWIGVALDEANGKNDGTVQGKKYFECPPNHGIFVRQTQLIALTEDDKVQQAIRSPGTGIIPPSTGASKIAGLRKPGKSVIKKPVAESPRLSGIKAPVGGGSKIASPSPPPQAQSPSPRGIARPGALSPPSGLSKPKSGLAKPSQSAQSASPKPTSPPESGIQKTASGLQKPMSPPQQSGLQRPGQSGLQKSGTGLQKPAAQSGLQKPAVQSGLQKPSAQSGIQKPGLQRPSSGLQRPSSASSKEKESPRSTTEKKSVILTPTGLKKPPSSSTPIQIKQVEESKEVSAPLEEPKEEAKAGPVQFLVGETKPAVEDSKPAPPPAHKVVAASGELLELQRKLMEKEKSVVDLEEKLNVLKQKRINDQAKLKEVEKLRIQNEQYAEYKNKWQESMRDLQNQLRQAQNEAREVADKMTTESDVTELQEAVEMATLDKEMAEEKFESLSQEHDQLKDKFEEVSLELEILKNEISEGGVETVAASAQSKQLEQQNMRLKDALVKLKDIAQNDKIELQQVTKSNKELSQQVSSLGADRDKLQERLQEALGQVDELKEQVDMALGAEEMVEKMTDKNLELEEKIEALEETVQDLEALTELNEELEESHIQTEHDLREELDMADNKIRELERQVIANTEQANDYQETIRKFRELVQNLQGRIKDLHDQSSDSIAVDELDTTPVPDVDFKTKMAEVKQHGRIIEIELNKYNVREANKKFEMINCFLPEHFTKRGADYDGICLLLLMERMEFKCQLLSSQLREKHDVEELVEGGQPLEGLKGDQVSYGCLLAYNLINFQLIISQFRRALGACDVHTFLRVCQQYPELSAYEKILDNYIELLRKDMLDDTVSLEVLEKTAVQFQNYYKLNLAKAERDCTDFLSDALVMFQHGGEAVAIDIQRLKGLAKGCEEGSVFLNLLKSVELKNIEIKGLCRKIKRRMIQDSNTTLSYPAEVTQELLDSMEEQNVLVRYVQDLASVLSLKASQLNDEESLLSGHLEESSQDCITMIYEKEGDPLEVLSESFTKVLMCLSGIAIKLPEGEYDTEPERKPEPAYLQRAGQFKEELSSTTKLEAKVDQKQQEVNEVKKALKNKSDELSEANIRISLLEKRADNASKEASTKVEQMSKKLEALQEEYYEKSKQNEKTMDALQSDIDALEIEKTDLKKKLEIYSKKSKLDFGALSQTSAAMAGIVAPGKPGSAMASLAKAGVAGTPQVQVVLKDSPVFLSQLDAQQKAIKKLQTENWNLKAAQMKAALAKLPKPYMPKVLWRDGKFVPNPAAKDGGDNKENADKEKKNAVVSSRTVMKDCNSLMTNLHNLSAFPKVVDITKKTKNGKYTPSPNDQLASQLNVLNTLIKQKDQLSKKVETVIAQELPGACVQTELRNFLSPEYIRVCKENKKPIHIASIHMPLQNANAKAGVRDVLVSPLEFEQIHKLLGKS